LDVPAGAEQLHPARSDLNEIIRFRYGGLDNMGWSPRMRLRFGYFTPDEFYEAVVKKLVRSRLSWLDVGSGRHIFPGNEPLAYHLADRCAELVGVDPDPTIDDNRIVRHRVKLPIEEFRTDQVFDVITMRMVAEHIAQPDLVLESLARLTKQGGRVVVYTVNKWSPVTLASWLTPFWLHHPLKRLLWRSEERDTFPVRYAMNTRERLSALFESHGFSERHFAYLDDCRTLSRFRALHFLELSAWQIARSVGLRYPENCLLGVYERA